MLPKFRLILVLAQLCAVCLGVLNITEPVPEVEETSFAKLYQTIPGRCQVTSELPIPTDVKYTGVIGYEYSNLTGHWYKFYAGPVVNWTDAREACRSDGADLAVPNSDTEAKVIMGLHARSLYSEIIDTVRQDWVSVGIFWENGTWKTVDGQFLENSGYLRGLEENKGDPSFSHGVMNRGGKLATTGSMLYPFVCEKETLRLEVIINYQ